MMRLAAGVLLAALVWAAAASAQGPDAACAFDVQKFCAGVKAGGGRIMACLKEHNADLSQGCKDAFAKAGKSGGAPKAAGGWYKSCEADVAKLCKDVPAGKGRIAQCLTAHSAQLSPTCKAMLENRPAAKSGTPKAEAAGTPAATAAAATPAATAKPTAKKKK